MRRTRKSVLPWPTWGGQALCTLLLCCCTDSNSNPSDLDATSSEWDATIADASTADGALPDAGDPATSQATIVRTITGHDWWLPEAAERASYSGEYWSKLTGTDTTTAIGMTEPHFAVTIDVDWMTVNPADGVYDWSETDAIVSQLELESPGMGFGFWPWYCSATYVPDWVTASHDIVYLSEGGIAGWEGDFMTLVTPMIQALGARYASHPRFVYAEIRTPYDWRNGEHYHQNQLSEIIAAGRDFTDWYKAFIDTWANAFSPNQQKLATVLAGGPWHPDTEEIIAHNYQAGCGQRDGMPSQETISNAVYGHVVDADGYLSVDANHPPVQDHTIFYGSENTEFDPDSTTWGDPEHTWIRMQFAVFWNLVTRRNWLALTRKLRTVEPYQSFLEWTMLELGQTVATTWDAWSWTRQGTWNNLGTIKNYERWLYQRDLPPDGETVATLHLGYDTYGSYNTTDVWEARRTDLASGMNRFYFDVSSDLMTGGPQHVYLLVTYLDETTTTWQIDYSGGPGIHFSTPAVTHQDSGEWKTVTFEVPDMHLDADPFANGMDFRISCTGAEDLTVKITRIVIAP